MEEALIRGAWNQLSVGIQYPVHEAVGRMETGRRLRHIDPFRRYELFALPVAIWFFRKEKWPVWPLLDILSIAAVLVHLFGRMGCFFAGCCYGIPTDSILGVTFTDEHSQAQPLYTSLHPTQLYEATLLISILGVLWMLKRHKRFEGQLFFIYIILYAAGRSIVEIFRGDLRRGFIIENVLSHSQFISILLIAVTVWLYLRFKKKASFMKK